MACWQRRLKNCLQSGRQDWGWIEETALGAVPFGVRGVGGNPSMQWNPGTPYILQVL